MTPSNIGGVSGPSIRPGLPESQPQPRVEGETQQTGTSFPRIPNGTMVNGLVLEARDGGAYLVRVAGQTLTAQASLPLLPGQHFRAVWDSSGDIPVLHLSDSEAALLGKFAEGDREVASALLSRGLSLDSQALASLRTAWTGMGGHPSQLASLAELWARGIPLTNGNVQILAWYFTLSESDVVSLWKKVREEMRNRVSGGEKPHTILKEMLEGDDERGAFLRGHALLSRPSREGVDPSLLSPALLPAGEGEDALTARIFTSAWKRKGRSYWFLAFEMAGERLGLVGGEVESDGKNMGITLKAEKRETFEVLRLRRRILRKQLDDLPLVVQNIAVALGRRVPRIPGRGFDITV